MSSATHGQNLATRASKPLNPKPRNQGICLESCEEPKRACRYMNCSLNSLKGGYIGDCIGDYIGDCTGDFVGDCVGDCIGEYYRSS